VIQQLDQSLPWNNPYKDVRKRGSMATVEAATKGTKNECKHLRFGLAAAAAAPKMEPLTS
jgi:hypothetical protein